MALVLLSGVGEPGLSLVGSKTAKNCKRKPSTHCLQRSAEDMGWHLGVSLGTMLRSSIQFLLSGSRDLDLGPLKSRAPVVRSGAHQGRAGAAQAAHRRKDAGIRGAGLRKAQRLQRTQCPVPRSTICEEARPKRRFVSSRTKTMMSPGPAARVGVLGVVGLFGPRCMFPSFGPGTK